MLSSCTHRLTDFTVISTKNVPIGVGPKELVKADVRVKGVDKKHVVLFIPLGTPNLKEAIDKAIESYPGAIGLTDGVVKSSWWDALLYGQQKYIVEGTPLLDPNAVKMQNSSNNNYNYNNSSTGSDVVRMTHMVKKGETLQSIANAYQVTVKEIVQWNQLNSIEVTEGTPLIIFMK